MDAAAAVSKAGSTAGLGGASVGSLSTGTVATMTLAAAALIGGGALWGASHFDELETRLARDLAAVEDVPPTRDEATGSDHLPGPTARLDSIEVELPPAHGGTLVETGADETRPSDNRPSDNRPSNNRDAAPSQAPVGKPLGAERAKPEQAREDESSPATPPVPRAAADKPRRPAVREQVPRRLEKRPASSSKRSVRKASERLRARLAARRTAAAPAPEAPAASAVSPTVQERVPGVSEVQMLLQARRALRNNPGRTLRLVEQHRQTFPRGTFEEEREALAIEAMWRVGQQREARRRGTRFLKRFPRSAHAARVRDLLGVR